MKLTHIFKELLIEGKKEKPSAGLTKKQKSSVAKRAKSGEDIGKKGKGFEKLADKAAKQYGSKEKGEKVAAAAMWKNIKRESANENIDEAIDMDTIQAVAAASAALYKGLFNIKVFNNFKPAMDAFKAAGDDNAKKKEVFKTYIMHLLNPTANLFKKLNFSGNNTNSSGNNTNSSGNNTNSITEAIDAHAIEVAAAALAALYKATFNFKVFNNFRPAIDAFKAAGDDDAKKKQVFKTYVMHLLNPTANLFKKLNFSGDKTNSIGEKPSITEGDDHEVSMAQNSLKSIMQSCEDLMNKLGEDERNIPGWIQDHITNAENYIDQAAQGFHELGSEEDEDNNMIQPVDEKKLTGAEKSKKKEILKAMMKKKGTKSEKGMTPKDYAIATAQAKKSAE